MMVSAVLATVSGCVGVVGVVGWAASPFRCPGAARRVLCQVATEFDRANY